MKKNKTQEQNRNPSRLRLNRETIQSLVNPAFLKLARGGHPESTMTETETVESTSQMSVQAQCY
jgi:hypothetical protein